MKKFISMVMAAAMVVSLVPATAFAADEASFKVIGDLELTEKQADDAKENGMEAGPQLQIKVKDVDSKSGAKDSWDIKLHLDNAEVISGLSDEEMAEVAEGKQLMTAYVVEEETDKKNTDDFGIYFKESVEAEDDVIELTIKELTDDVNLTEGDIIVLGLPTNTLVLTKSSTGTEATVKVTGDFGESDAMTFAAVMEEGIDVDVDDTVDVAEEEFATLEDITIEPAVRDSLMDEITWDKSGKAELTLKLNSGFEFVGNTFKINGKTLNDVDVDDNKITIELQKGEGLLADAEEWVISGLEIEATTAKAGDIATITVGLDDVDSVKVEVATVVSEGLEISVDEDEDVPVIWSGVNSDNAGLTSDDSHEALEVTVEELVAGSYSNKDEIEFTLPEGVYVVACDDNFKADVMKNAYVEGDFESFVIEKRVIEETDPDKNQDPFEYNFTLTLVADPGFVGPVDMTMLVDGEEVGTVTIAEFATPMVVEAAQNDLIIDYRNTEVPTDIVVKEAEAGLWEKGLTVAFGLDKGIDFEGDATFTVNEESGMEVDDDTTTHENSNDEKVEALEFVVDEESDEEAAVVTISDIELYMSRNLAAGAYDLEMVYNSAVEAYEAEKLMAEDHDDDKDGDCTDDCIEFVTDVCDYSTVVKEGFVNIVTAGRDADDASFTTKVVVPVGAMEIIAGEETVALDVPAYINAAGYTMLPVRAVAVALGIHTNNVIWDQATKTVTILYGQRIITMTVGSKVINVNGSAIPASAAVEVVNGRTFLGLRDLATALGVVDITWDAATQTATLNGNK